MDIYGSNADREKLYQLQEAKNAFVEEYNRKLANYTAQESSYKSAYSDYEDRVAEEVRSLLADELKALPDVDISVVDIEGITRVHDVDRYFGLMITYKSERLRSRDRESVHHPYYRDEDFDSHSPQGFNWRFLISWSVEERGNGASDTSRVICKEPIIDADKLDSSDYSALAATYAIFAKIDTIDWTDLLTRIENETPREDEFVTTEHPGSLDTSEFDKQIFGAELDSYIGKDYWIRVDYYATGNTSYADKMYIRVVRKNETGKYYYCNVVKNGWQCSITDLPISCSPNAYNRLTTKLEKLRKGGLKIVQPIDVIETDELLKQDDTGTARLTW